MSCRDINELNPLAQTACNLFLSECKSHGLDIFITETYRSQDRQNQLYEQGRSAPGRVVTWTKNSRHTSRMAWDIACNGGTLYHSEMLKKAGLIGSQLGITWGGSWDTPDMPHFEINKSWKQPKTKPKITKAAALELIKARCGFDESTMLYLQMYRFADSMIIRLAEQLQN